MCLTKILNSIKVLNITEKFDLRNKIQYSTRIARDKKDISNFEFNIITEGTQIAPLLKCGRLDLGPKAGSIQISSPKPNTPE